jgi:hypothetical protein
MGVKESDMKKAAIALAFLLTMTGASQAQGWQVWLGRAALVGVGVVGHQVWEAYHNRAYARGYGGGYGGGYGNCPRSGPQYGYYDGPRYSRRPPPWAYREAYYGY